jgi:hypothetical protein
MMLHCRKKIQFPFMMREMRFMNEVIVSLRQLKESVAGRWTRHFRPLIILPPCTGDRARKSGKRRFRLGKLSSM